MYFWTLWRCHSDLLLAFSSIKNQSVKNINVYFFHSLLLVWEGHMRGIFWVSVLIFLEVRHSFSWLDCIIYHPKEGRSWILWNLYAYDRGGGLQRPPNLGYLYFFGSKGNLGKACCCCCCACCCCCCCCFFLKSDSGCLAHDEFLVIFNFKRDHSLMYMYVFGIVPLLLGTVLHYTT